MSYEGVPIHELKSYLTQRGLPVDVGPNKKVTLTGLKAQLQEADEDITFRLSGLPPELRNIIFSYYFDSVVEFSNVPLRQQPPISQVSCIVRRETLPLFFKRFAFTFNYSRYTKRFAADSERYLSCTTAHSFALIQHFTIRITIRIGYYQGLTVSLRNNNNNNNNSFSFEITPPWNKRGNEHLGIRNRVSAAVESLLREIMTRGEAWNPRTTDIEALRTILEDFDKPIQG
jgi:hypothetical protein